ncbi:hypothetical protein F907_00194 [Acinetobacter colistiniresistens]|uniref:Uncharacterized protein n=1 Tax=Acinetobacter colistiniresistens TaxID=280145 RepID=S3U3T0_9GAMM|nr:hypothetical protein F907_00194 [Acinetobacter colistiniresistens]
MIRIRDFMLNDIQKYMLGKILEFPFCVDIANQVFYDT